MVNTSGGNPARRIFLSTLGVEALANYLIEKVQKRIAAGACRSMTSTSESDCPGRCCKKVEIVIGGDTPFMSASTLTFIDFEDAMKSSQGSRKKEPAAKRREANRLLPLVSTKGRRPPTRSCISAASFSRNDPACSPSGHPGKIDTLDGLEGERHRRIAPDPAGYGRWYPPGSRVSLPERDTKLKAKRASRNARLQEEAANLAMAALPAQSPEPSGRIVGSQRDLKQKQKSLPTCRLYLFLSGGAQCNGTT